MITDNKLVVKCNNCKIEFYKTKTEINRSKTGKHYCSRSCSASKNNLFIQRNKAKFYKCVMCYKDYCRTKDNRSNKLCLECKQKIGNYSLLQTNIIKNQSIKEYSYNNNIHPSWRFARIRALNRSWNKQLTEYPCQVCGYNYHVELAHIKPLSSFDDNTLLSVVNDPSNILVLCPNHHWEFDNNKIILETIPAR